MFPFSEHIAADSKLTLSSDILERHVTFIVFCGRQAHAQPCPVKVARARQFTQNPTSHAQHRITSRMAHPSRTLQGRPLRLTIPENTVAKRVLLLLQLHLFGGNWQILDCKSPPVPPYWLALPSPCVRSLYRFSEFRPITLKISTSCLCSRFPIFMRITATTR